MKVIWAGTFEPAFERNKRIAEYLRHADVSVRIVRSQLWPSDRVAAFQSQRWRVLVRMAYVYPWLVIRLLMNRRPDIYLVSYPGWFDVPAVRLVAALKHRPVVFDVFISLYDTAVSDRGLTSARSVAGRVALVIDRTALRLSDLVLADCAEHSRFLAELAGLDPDDFGILYLGADEAIFQPTGGSPRARSVLFFGNFIPLQGAEVIVGAASKPAMADVAFKLIGTGQTWEQTQELARELGVTNVEFPGRMAQSDLVREMARSSVCLGIFGTTSKADRVVPHKLYEALACGRPVITGDTTAIRELFSSEEVLKAEPNPDSLAEVINAALADQSLLSRVASAGRSRFEREFSIGPQSDRLISLLEGVEPRKRTGVRTGD